MATMTTQRCRRGLIAVLAIAAGVAGGGLMYLRRGAQPVVSAAERHYRAGVEQARAGQEREAVAQWNLAIAMNPADPRPYDALEAYWEAAGHPEQAAATMERLTKANPAAPHRDC